MFTCPRCGVPLGELRSGETFDDVCPSCRYRYQVTTGQLGPGSRWPMTAHDSRPTVGAIGGRSYELHVALGPSLTEVARFTHHHRRDPIVVSPGDTVALVYTMRRDRRDQLVQVLNLTTNERFEVARPGVRTQSAVGCGALIVAWVVFNLLLTRDAAPIAVLLVPMGTFALIMFAATKLAEPKHRLSDHEIAVRKARQPLLVQKHALVIERTRVAADRAERVVLREKLDALRAKMREVALPAYAPRIESLTHAIDALDQQIALDGRLHDGYDKSIKILEIEYEAGDAVRGIPDDVAASMASRMEELRALEEQHAELGRLVQANAEIERHLRGEGEGDRSTAS
jgi:hypothetical protein